MDYCGTWGGVLAGPTTNCPNCPERAHEDGLASSGARQRFDTRFRRTRVVLPVIHAATESQVLANTEIARIADADGVFLINHMGGCDELLSMYAAARAHHSDWWIGINCLDLTPLELLAQVGEDVDGVWADNADVDERRDTQPEAEAARHAGSDRGWPGLYFGGVAFKYQRPVADLERAARLARGYMDVITTSGPGTGQAAERAKISAIRAGAGDHPLALASGVTPENVEGFLPWVDAYLVATGISRDFEHLDPGRTRALVERVHDGP